VVELQHIFKPVENGVFVVICMFYNDNRLNCYPKCFSTLSKVQTFY